MVNSKIKVPDWEHGRLTESQLTDMIETTVNAEKLIESQDEEIRELKRKLHQAQMKNFKPKTL